MSLTRAQWVQMWEAIKRIEYRRLHRPSMSAGIDDIKLIKDLIQQVIGQME